VNINLRQLKAFVALYQSRNFAAAAERLFLTHSAVSVLIRQLEAEIGEKLFDRTTRTIRPTAAANDLLPLAERALREVSAIDEHFRGFSSGTLGKVSFAVTPALGVNFAPRAMRLFIEANPNMQVALEDCAPDQFVKRILSEQVEFGIGAPELVTSDIDCVPLIRDHLGLVLRANDPLARNERVLWTDLKDQPVIALKPGYGIRHLIDAALIEAGVSLRFAYEVSFLATALALAAEGLGVAVLPVSLTSDSRYPQLVARRLASPTVTRDICIVTKHNATLSPAAQVFLAFLKSALSDGRIVFAPAI
jgi:DNA-binding transcriptional LysR family regulator